MAYANFSNNAKPWLFLALICLAGWWLWGCPRPVEIPPPIPSEPSTDNAPADVGIGRPSEPDPSRAEAALQARRSAAEEMVRQGRRLLDRGQTDAAIRVLERAAALDPGGGRPYFYLAEAWYRKQDAGRAREFNALAERALATEPGWASRIGRQLDRIDELEQ